MGRVLVQNETERSTSEEFAFGDIHMLLDESDIVHIDHTTTRKS